MGETKILETMKITSGFLLAASNVLADNPADGLGPGDAACTSNGQCGMTFQYAQCQCEKQADGNNCVEGSDAATCACLDFHVMNATFVPTVQEALPDTMPCDEDDACPANSHCTDVPVVDPAEEAAFLAECTCNDGFIKSDDGES